MSGAEAVGLSAILSGLQFYAGYPDEPVHVDTGIPRSTRSEHGIMVRQTEDEISAINMALGASWAGCRAMTGSAGGGFSLMVEGLSLAGMTETPITIALCSRPGPATGLATRQAQADLLFACHAGHGELNRVIFAPGTAEQAFHATNQAFDITEEYQVPAILLLDQHLNDSYWTLGPIDESRLMRQRYQADAPDLAPYAYKRYSLGNGDTPPRDVPISTVSPLLRPGTPNQVRYDDSDEHTEEGHIAESAEIRRAMVRKRLGKAAAISMELTRPNCWPPERTKTVVLCFGSTYGVAREAVDNLIQKGASISLMHLNEILPFPREACSCAPGQDPAHHHHRRQCHGAARPPRHDRDATQDRRLDTEIRWTGVQPRRSGARAGEANMNPELKHKGTKALESGFRPKTEMETRRHDEHEDESKYQRANIKNQRPKSVFELCSLLLLCRRYRCVVVVSLSRDSEFRTSVVSLCLGV